jgi:hypothetical protein
MSFDERRHNFKSIQIYCFQYYNGIHNSNIDIVVCVFVCLIFGDIIAHQNIIAFVQWFDFLLPVKLSCLFRGCLKHSWGWKTKWGIYHSISASSTLIINIFRNVEIFKKKFFFSNFFFWRKIKNLREILKIYIICWNGILKIN